MTIDQQQLHNALRAFGRMAQRLSRAMAPFHRRAHYIHVGLAPDGKEAARRFRERRRCRVCYPHSNPRPLAIDGHEYRRRAAGRRNR